MELRFSVAKIAYWAKQYDYPEESSVTDLVERVKECGFVTLEQLRVVARWKSPRSAGRVESNDGDYVRAITGFSLQTKNERAKIESLTLLDGVQWPTASVILHFFDAREYPILDYRALWSVGVRVPRHYSFRFWWEYVVFCRELAHRTGHDIRTLDRALWSFSKANQERTKEPVLGFWRSPREEAARDTED